jgi:hypothetical protein
VYCEFLLNPLQATSFNINEESDVAGDHLIHILVKSGDKNIALLFVSSRLDC